MAFGADQFVDSTYIQTPTTDSTSLMLQQVGGSGSMTGAASSSATADAGSRSDSFPWLYAAGFALLAWMFLGSKGHRGSSRRRR